NPRRCPSTTISRSGCDARGREPDAPGRYRRGRRSPAGKGRSLMSKFMEGVSTVNSFLRTLLMLAVLGGAGTAGYYAYTGYHAKETDARRSAELLDRRNRELASAKDRLNEAEANLARQATELRAKDDEIARLQANVKKLELALHYLKIDHRV